MRHLIVLLSLLVCMGHLVAQPFQHYIFTHLSSRNGLASDDIRGITQDTKGYIWIATMNGLQRYDGRRFITLASKPGDLFSIPNNKIYNIRNDRRNRLWLHCGTNRVGYINPADLKFHEAKIKFSEELVKRTGATLFVTGNDKIMLLLFRETILTYDEAANEFSEKNTPFTLPKKWRPRSLFVDKKENYWIATDSGLVKYNPSTKNLSYSNHNTDNDPVINAFAAFTFVAHPFLDQAGRFWIERWSQQGAGPYIHSYDINSKKRTDWDAENTLTEGIYHENSGIFEQEDGTIWIVGMNIMAALPKDATKFENIPSNLPGEFSIRYDNIRTLFQDKEKNIWVCTDRGLYRFNPAAQMFSIIANHRPGTNSFSNTDVTDILQTTESNILVSTWGDGTFAYNSSINPISLPFIKQPLPKENLLWALYQRKNGDIWQASQAGMLIITSSDKKQTLKLTPPVFEGSTIRQLTEDKNGNMWIGTHWGHIVKWTEATNTFKLVHKTSTIYRLYTDRNGDIWACTGGDGVFRISPAYDAITAQYSPDGQEGKRLMGMGAQDIVQYNDSIYIIASETLNMLNAKTGTIQFMGREKGFAGNSVNNIFADKNGYLWGTTEDRLFRLHPFKTGASIFNEEDGLPASSFNVGSMNVLQDGRVAIGRTHDFIVFHPDSFALHTMKLPQPEITAFAVMNAWLQVDSLKKLPGGKGVTLRHNENSITVEFSTLTYMNHFPVQYMLKGLDKKWSLAGESNQAVYNYLPPGDYTLMLKCENGEGGVSEITTLKISVQSPFWQTWWFYCLLALLVVAVFYFIDKERMRRKETIQKMRGEIADNLHEEINTALNNINVLSEIARLKADSEPEQSKGYINEIHSKSHNMIIAMDDMLWSIDPANDNMGKTIDRIREFSDALRNRYNVSIELETSEKVTSLKPAMKVRHELMLIYKLALRLLVEELGAAQTTIHIHYVQSMLQLNIFSPGLQLNESNNQVIKIAEEMKSRANSIKAILEMQSDEKGIAIILAVKAV